MTTSLVTIDSSIFISSLVNSETNYTQANLIMNKVIDGIYQVILPWSVLVEVICAIKRRTNNDEIANYIKEFLMTLDNIEFVELNETRSVEAAKIGINGKLRGMDSIILQVVQEYQTELISYDKEMVDYYNTNFSIN